MQEDVAVLAWCLGNAIVRKERETIKVALHRYASGEK
jgi:2-polyprenyl-6-methoxyphenol hydroxylase-like FAD-dependent oxidoreductase